jgi:hypothetical protein
MTLRVLTVFVGATLVLGVGLGFSQEAPPLNSQMSMATTASLNGTDSDASVASVPQPKPSFFASWDNRVRVTLAGQPSWPIPLVTASSGLIEVFRYDFVRQVTPAGTDTWIYGNTKGLNLIPWYNVEFDTLIPSYIQHNSPAVQDGFGDLALLLKYRLAAGNASHGDYSISASLGTTLPTGSYKNGSRYATISPTIYAGKGFGRLAVQTTLGAFLSTEDTVKIGEVMAWNTAAQYRVGKWFWPEVENNASFYFGGKNDGLMQNFVTPGLIFSKLKLSREPQSRLSLTFGGGMQIATSHFHAYNHALVFTLRTCF